MSIPSKKKISIDTVFHSISDLHNIFEVNKAIKKLASIPSRLALIDLLLKRKEEIKISNEQSYINKLGPVFNRLKQKFLQRLRMSKMAKSNLSPLKSPLFTKPLVLDENKREVAKKKTVLAMIASLNHHGQGVQKLTDENIQSTKLINNKNASFQLHQGNASITVKIPKDLRNKSQVDLCKFSSVFNANSNYTGILEKSLVKFVKNNIASSSILNTSSPCKSMEIFDSKIKQKLSNLLNKDQHCIKMKKPNKQIKISTNHIRTYSNILPDVKDQIPSNKDEESYLSFTELKLMSLYKESRKEKGEMEINKKNYVFDKNFRDIKRKKLRK